MKNLPTSLGHEKDADVTCYKTWLRIHGVSPKALGYGGEISQHVRFRQFVRFNTLSGLCILDLGCGLAELCDYLFINNNIPSRYTGVDAVAEFIEAAKERLAETGLTKIELCLESIGPFLDDINTKNIMYDWVIACGIFNGETYVRANTPRDVDIQRTIIQMWRAAKSGIMFNMENGLKQPERSINLDPGYWLNFVSKELSTKTIFTSDYHDSDFTIIVSK